MPSVKDLVRLDPVWAGSIPLPIPIVFARTGGGYLNCVDAATGKTAVCTGWLRRWDPRRSAPVGIAIATCILTEVDPAHGRYEWDWLISDLGGAPTDPGIYLMHIDLLMPSGHDPFSQRALIEVLSSGPFT